MLGRRACRRVLDIASIRVIIGLCTYGLCVLSQLRRDIGGKLLLLQRLLGQPVSQPPSRPASGGQPPTEVSLQTLNLYRTDLYSL